jgi:hypothetical protein
VISGQRQCFVCWHNTDLLAIWINDANFFRPDIPVDPCAVGRPFRFSESSGYGYPTPPVVNIASERHLEPASHRFSLIFSKLTSFARISRLIRVRSAALSGLVNFLGTAILHLLWSKLPQSGTLNQLPTVFL